MCNKETITRFIELRARGVPYDDIAVELNVNRRTLLRWAQKHQPRIQAFAAIEAELLRNKFFCSRQKEIEALAKRLARLEREIDERNPQYMATREITDLIRVTRDRLDKLCAEPTLPEEAADDAEDVPIVAPSTPANCH